MLNKKVMILGPYQVSRIEEVEMSRMKQLIDQVLERTLGTAVVSLKENDKPWDETFSRWISVARAKGGDPNDFGDQEWGDPTLALERFYYPHLASDKTLLELGPGTGRHTRHFIGRCAKIILVDYSKKVVQWLNEYMQGKGDFEIFHVTDCSLSPVADHSVDVVFANGVFEHLYPEQFYLYLLSFYRILKPGGALVLNFDNFVSPGGFKWFKEWIPPNGGRGIFRFYHPDTVRQMCEDVGFRGVSIYTDETRMAYLQCRRAS
jgi:SAM-dependent methyltransferase